MDIKQAITLCIESAATSRSLNTAHSYGNGLDLFVIFLDEAEITEDASVKEIIMEHFIRFPGWLASKGYTKKTMGVYLSGAKYFMDWLVMEGSIRPDYYDMLRYEKARKLIGRKKEDHMVRFPQPNEVARMLDAVRLLPYETPRKERDIAIIEFLASTGARNSELCGLRISDIDNKVESAIVTGKGEKERRVFLSSSASQSLREYWKIRGVYGRSEPAFIRHDKGAGKKILPLTTATIRNIVKEVSMLAGIEIFTPHYFRHAFAIKMLQETHDLALVQDLLGHTSPVATRVYAKIYPEDLKKAHNEVYN